MVVTPSTMADLGMKAPSFTLPDVYGNQVSLDDFRDKKALLVMFISRHCPYVQHVKHELARLGRDYADKSVGIVAVSSNDIRSYPEDSPEKLAWMAEELGFTFPVCFDETQQVAKAYRAACTPDFYLFDEERKLVYRGQLDDSRPGNNIPVTGKDLRAAIDAVLEGRPVNPNQKPSLGCNIKWKPGNEPDYFRL
ncbi:MAG TPA: thioredoxin family protein [Acidobacteriota bacterium]|nr:thioredoxin family protein [Acidobacteriota bacterium]HRR26525.1 thioredoxin family protein [Acidobacteriota bacterium]